MTYNEIENILQNKYPDNAVVKINFRTRNSVNGIFIKTADYKELSRKNLWRIVSATYMDAYRQSHDESLARIFNGSEFTKLELVR